MTTIDIIKARNEEAGQHFFSPSTMAFFDSIVYDETFGNHFVTSEKGPDGARLYTIRFQNEDGTIDTVGDFQAWPTLPTALRAAEMIEALRAYQESTLPSALRDAEMREAIHAYRES